VTVCVVSVTESTRITVNNIHGLKAYEKVEAHKIQSKIGSCELRCNPSIYVCSGNTV
jgi:hypothetical protein